MKLFTTIICFCFISVLIAENITLLPKKTNPEDKWSFLQPVIAEVDGKKISKDDFMTYFKVSLAGKVPSFVSSKKLKRIAPKMIEEYLKHRIFLQEAIDSGIKPNKKMAEKYLMDSFMSQTEEKRKTIKNNLKKRNISFNQFLSFQASSRYNQETFAIEKWLNSKYFSKIKITDEEIEKYYKRNIRHFTRRKDSKQELRLSHILIAVKKDKSGSFDPDAQAAAKKKSEDILKKIKDGESFEKLAKANSACPFSSKNGGAIGSFHKNDASKEFGADVIDLKIGEIRGGFKSSKGYHIIRRNQPSKGRVIPFSEAKSKIKQNIMTSRKLKTKKTITEDMFKKHKVVIKKMGESS